jgi:hypothetical protein
MGKSIKAAPNTQYGSHSGFHGPALFYYRLSTGLSYQLSAWTETLIEAVLSYVLPSYKGTST